ncbi:MAG: 2-oxoglutarate dehydrogenase complex dihydrolipoyllysine-residue succinyltransferase [Pirellulaceae bacterium]
MPVEVTVPEVGESIQEVQILKWRKHEGDHVEKDEDLVEIETDKATVAIPSPASGSLDEIVKADGDYAEVGDVIARLTKGEGKSAEKSAEKDSEGSSDQPASEEGKKVGSADERNGGDDSQEKPRSARKTEERAKSKREASDEEPEQRHGQQQPERRKAREEEKAHEPQQPDDESAQEKASRQPEDEQREEPSESEVADEQAPHREEQVEEEPEVEQEEAAETSSENADQAEAQRETREAGEREEERVPMSILRRTVARRLVEAQQNAALVTTFNEIDMQEANNLRNEFKSEFREQFDVKLGYMSLFVKAAVEALKECPEVNAKVVGDEIVYRNYFDIGIAIGSNKGLVVPVLRDCQRLSFADIEQQIDDFAKRANEGRIEPEELEGGTFTITNGGIYGSLLSTPIVNPPQSGVLGMHAIHDRPVARDGEVAIRPMMYVALTYDHRIVDGREAVGFLVKIREIVELPARLILEV